MTKERSEAGDEKSKKSKCGDGREKRKGRTAAAGVNGKGSEDDSDLITRTHNKTGPILRLFALFK